MRKRCFFFLLLLVAACGRRDLPVLSELPPFRLVSHENKTVTLEDLKGKVWVANFIFTSCAGTCPRLTERMKLVQESIRQMRQKDPALPARIVSFSVDPERDTPQKLADYAQRFKVDARVWLFLTGSWDEVRDTVINGFKVSMGKVKAEVPGAQEVKSNPDPEAEIFEVVHGERFVLIDAQGRIRGYYSSEGPGLRDLLDDMEFLLKQAKR